MKLPLITILLILTWIPILVHAECTCESETSDQNKSQALKFKIAAIVAILVAGAIGVSLPVLGKFIPIFCPKNDVFVIIKAFAAGVILSTGFVHVLPDASENLTSPCLNENPWGKFPFSGFVAMLSGIAALLVDSFARSYHSRVHKEDKDIENHGHAHSTDGHVHGLHGSDLDPNSSCYVHHRIRSQVLELGILVHSVIIGVSLGASLSPSTIKPLVGALTFHQLFEGMGLGGSIFQANFKVGTIAVMAIFFSLTTPIGIMVGIGISNIYDENSPTALIVEGIFNSASAGILIYMALVHLIAEDFMNPKLQANLKLQLGATLSLLLGSGCMSLLAIWA